MLNLILDEKKYAENIIERGLLDKHPKEVLYLLAKYYRFIGQKNDEIIKSLNNFMKNNYKNYNPVEWSDTIEYDVNKTKKKKLNQIEYIPVTKNELKTIGEIKNKDLRVIAFTLVCIAKFNNFLYIENHDWIKQNQKEIFVIAGIKRTEIQQDFMINDLKTMGLITLSKKIDNTSLNIQYVDNESEIVLKITDCRALGYEYLKYIGDKITSCEDCGILMKAKTDQKRCPTCNKVHRREYLRLKKQQERN